MSDWNKLKLLLQKLTGQEASLIPDPVILPKTKNSDLTLGHSQFNELLLAFGYDKISESFFQLIVDGTIDYKRKPISSFDHFEDGVVNFQTLSLLLFGNVKFAFKRLSKKRSVFLLRHYHAQLSPIDKNQFANRHNSIFTINEIPGDKAYFLGYYIEGEIKKLKNKNPKEAKKQENERKKWLSIGRTNFNAYLASDHLDVYVATSMRNKHEFLFINDLTKKIFTHKELFPLKVRWFDPTQAYCKERIDKGLSEALMLKRAKCTIYLAQESETLGKDSELASTLAQGKPVIAFIPYGNKKFVDDLIENLKIFDKKTEIDLIIDQLKIFNPNLIWDNKSVRNLIINRDHVKLKESLYKEVNDNYEVRASNLIKKHPLGIQVNLNSGVANGVLVVRTIEDCAKLVKSILLNSMDFELGSLEKQKSYLVLREKISNCIFRVMTDDIMISNTFWNYFKEPNISNND